VAYEPPKDFPRHGGEGKGPYGAGWPDDELTTPNFRGRRLGGHEPDAYSPDYAEHTTTHVNPPSDPDAIGVDKHPFKLERYLKTPEDEDGEPLPDAEETDKLVSLRVYYGELWDTISIIRTESVATDKFGIASQDAIPGIQRTVLPDFIFESEDDDNNIIRSTLKYAEFNEEEPGDGGAYGTVILEWVVNADAGAVDDDGNSIPIGVTDAVLSLLPAEEEPDADTEMGALGIADGELKRADDADGIYSMVIGESRDPGQEDDDGNLVNEDLPPIDQQVYDHVYWAPTIVMGSESSGSYESYPLIFIDKNSSRRTSTKPKQVVALREQIDKLIINGNKNVQGKLN